MPLPSCSASSTTPTASRSPQSAATSAYGPASAATTTPGSWTWAPAHTITELGHFISADSVVPDLYRPQSLNRYSLTEGDPANHGDRSGHMKMQVEQRKERASEKPFAAMYNRMISAECSGVFGVSCVRATPGAFYEERSGRLKTKQGDKVISDTEKVIKSWSGGVGADGDGPGTPYVEGQLASGVVVRRVGTSAATAPQAPTGTVTVEEGFVAGIHTPHGVVPTDENGTPYPETREQWLWLQCHGDPACTLAKAVDWQGVGKLIEIIGIQQLTSPLSLLKLGEASGLSSNWVRPAGPRRSTPSR